MGKSYNKLNNRYRLALDMGSSSIGWAILALNKDDEPSNIMRTGVRIFSDGRDARSQQPLAVERREKRQMRRMRDRYLQRMGNLLKALLKYGMISSDPILINKNPLELRKNALYGKLTLHELGRAIFHLSKKRGFKSNRKTDKKNGSDAGKVES